MASDNFNRANEDPLGAPWAKLPGSAGNVWIDSNHVVTDDGANQGNKFYYYDGAAVTDKQFAECVVGNAGLDGGPAVRIGGGTGFTGYAYVATLNGIGKFVNGSFSDPFTHSPTSVLPGDTVRLEVETNSGTGNVEVRAYINGVLKISDVDAQIDKITGAGEGVGFFLFTTPEPTHYIDDWQGGDLGAVVPPSAPQIQLSRHGLGMGRW